MATPYLKTLAVIFVPILVGSALVCLLVYGVAQQVLRLNANDPQIQIAEDVAGVLSTGVPPTQLSGASVDVSKSLATFVMIFDASGTVVASQAVLDGAAPVPPKGVFAAAQNMENRVTWQPKSGVRIAAVVSVYHSGETTGYVLAGRSLREVERRVDSIGLDVLFGWFIMNGIGLLAASLIAFRRRINQQAILSE